MRTTQICPHIGAPPPCVHRMVTPTNAASKTAVLPHAALLVPPEDSTTGRSFFSGLTKVATVDRDHGRPVFVRCPQELRKVAASTRVMPHW